MEKHVSINRRTSDLIDQIIQIKRIVRKDEEWSEISVVAVAVELWLAQLKDLHHEQLRGKCKVKSEE